jgi:hypothetical protein
MSHPFAASLINSQACPLVTPLIIGLLSILVVILAWALLHPDPRRRAEAQSLLALLISGWRGR